MAALSRQTSETFRAANLIAIALVVAIHYNSKHYIDVASGLGLNYYIQEWLTNSVARVAVPFFAFAAGFFYFLHFKNLDDYWLQLKKRIWSLFIPYGIAVSVVFLHDTSLTFLKGQPLDLSLVGLISLFFHPDSVQFWFLRDLILLVLILCPLIHVLMNRLPILTLSLLFLAWANEFQFFPRFFGWYLINVEVLFFFTVGCFFAQHPDKLERLLEACLRHWTLLLFIFLIMTVARVVWAPQFTVWYGVHGGGLGTLWLYKLTILAGLPALYIVARPIRNNRLVVWLSAFSFFIFLYHIKPVSTVSFNLSSIALSDSFLFYFTFPLAIILSVLAGWGLRVYFPKLYSFVSGGR
ncbi:MAG: acyltransferase family protein [Rickettsiales bacterium]